MQEKIHNITLEKRQKLLISECSQVISFNENEVIVAIDEETLIIRGIGLKVEEVSKANGEAVITGESVDSLIYSKSYAGKREGIFRRMFK